MKKQKGFTLVELLVVISIIGILATLVLVSMMRTKQKGRDASRRSNLNQISLAMKMANDDEQAYPASATLPDSIATDQATYMEAVPSDPQGGIEYSWTDNTGNDQIFCIGADLELGDYFVCDHNGCSEKNNNCP